MYWHSLQTHAGSVIEQMDTLMTLKNVVEENKTKYGPDMTASVENSILSTYKTLRVIIVTLN